MFCARCGSPVGPQDSVCPQCSLDLRLSGSVRMTDPALEETLHHPLDPIGDATVVLPGADTRSAGDVRADETPTRPFDGVPADASDGEPVTNGTRTEPPSVTGAPEMPADWFRDPEAERTAVMRPVAPAPAVFSPPAPPTGPDEPEERPRQRRGASGLAVLAVVLLVALVLLVLVVWWLIGRGSGSAIPAVPRVTPSASVAASSSRPAPSAAESSAEVAPSTSVSATSETSTGVPSRSAGEEQSTPAVSPSSVASSAAASLPAGAKQCADGVGAAGSASCPFAIAVADAVPQNSSGTFHVVAHSPVTGKDYDMTCVAATLTTCTGGNDAVVYIAR